MMLLPIIGVSAVVLFIVAKLRHQHEPDGVELTPERMRILIKAERDDQMARGEEL
jgi:hypothetical protein